MLFVQSGESNSEELEVKEKLSLYKETKRDLSGEVYVQAIVNHGVRIVMT